MENKIIGSKIAEARKKNNISQAQLAQRLFISSQAVGKWERGESFPDIITFNRLAKIFGVDLNYFSDDFRSVATEIATAGNLVIQPIELPPTTLKQKLNWDMSAGNWVDADFSGLKNLKDKFSSSNMKNCRFIGSELSRLLLKNNNIDSCDFSGSDISSSQIQSSNLVNNLFKGCSLKETEFSDSNIKGCDFSGSDFTGTALKSSAFRKNETANAVWNHTSFNAMHIADIVFEGIFEDCYFENCAFTRVTFQNTTIINTFFKGKSLKRIRFIECKADKLTYAFLKNGKADLAGITLFT